MIRCTSGDLLKSEAEALVNPVNCAGVMGKGLALQFKKAFPECFPHYREACASGCLVPGSVLVFERSAAAGPRYIISFPTKRHWREKSREEYIVRGLEDLLKTAEELHIRSAALPALGCGLGGLSWERVRKIIEDKLSESTVEFVVYAPEAASDSEHAQTADASSVLLHFIRLVKLYKDRSPEPSVTLLELQKLVYFAERLGAGFGFRFVKGHYGPYTNLAALLGKTDRRLLTKSGCGLFKVLNFTEYAFAKAAEGRTAQDAVYSKLASLIDGFETPDGLELLASADWVLENEAPQDDADLVRRIHARNLRKKSFSEEHILQAQDRLARTFKKLNT
jgi:O-acetyl-ADP-ribose deacetylase (regulator of RNase III)